MSFYGHAMAVPIILSRYNEMAIKYDGLYRTLILLGIPQSISQAIVFDLLCYDNLDNIYSLSINTQSINYLCLDQSSFLDYRKCARCLSVSHLFFLSLSHSLSHYRSLFSLRLSFTLHLLLCLCHSENQLYLSVSFCLPLSPSLYLSFPLNLSVCLFYTCFSSIVSYSLPMYINLLSRTPSHSSSMTSLSCLSFLPFITLHFHLSHPLYIYLHLILSLPLFFSLASR